LTPQRDSPDDGGVAVVFVNYRVQEQPGYATLLHRELAHRFGTDAVFLASRSIRPGDDFVREVFDNLRQSDVFLALIGTQWLEFSGHRNAQFDWVHWEIAEAFRLGIRVVPVLIEDAELPDETALPDDIAALRRCQYVRLRHYSVEADLALLINELAATTPALRDSRDSDAVAAGEASVFQVGRDPQPKCRIAVVPGDIRRVRSIDVWVNSENTDMQMARVTEFSTSAVIRYWGAVRDESGQVLYDVIAAELDTRVGTHRPVAPGTVVVTGSGCLAASNNVRHVIHVAAVHGEPGAGFQQVRDIGWCVTNALSHATRLAAADSHVRSVLFPLLGTGMAGAAIEPTARTMLLAALDYIIQQPGTPLREIVFLAYSERERSIFHQLLRTMPVLPVSTNRPENDH
jgi:O-acetyl-ADP-ribose deacetylase (regulator of RNase III)